MKSAHLLARVFSGAFLACAGLLTITGDPFLATAQETFPVANMRWRVTPPVIWCGDTFSLEVQIAGRNDVGRVPVFSRGDFDSPAKSSSGTYDLYDDGRNGDRVSGDNVFTLRDIKPSCNPQVLSYGQSAGQSIMNIERLFLKNGTALFLDQPSSTPISVGIVDSRFKNVFQVRDLGNGLSATAFAFFINDAKHEIYNDYTQAIGMSPNAEAWRKLYSVLPDAFDISVLTRGESLIAPISGVSFGVAVWNQVKFIGMPPSDERTIYSSRGRLKSTIWLAFSTIDQFAHELGHSWGAYIGSSLGLVDGAHWNRSNNNSLGGQLGGCSFYVNTTQASVGYLYESKGDGTFRGVPCRGVYGQYSPLELYVMGLIPAEQVPPIYFLIDPDHRNIERITARSVRSVTIQDIIRAEGGVRSPSVSESQKDFTVAFMVTDDRPYTDTSYAYFSLLAYWLMSRNPPAPGDNSYAPVFWASGGRVTINSRLPVNLPEPPGLPPLIGLRVNPTTTPTLISPTVAPTTPPTQIAVSVPTQAPNPGPIATIVSPSVPRIPDSLNLGYLLLLALVLGGGLMGLAGLLLLFRPTPKPSSRALKDLPGSRKSKPTDMPK